MKTTHQLLFGIIGSALLAAGPILRAEDPSAAPPAPSACCLPPPGGEGHHEHGGMKGAMHHQLRCMKECLGLTEDQIAKIKPILHNEMKQHEAIHAAAQDQIRGLLTPEQQKKFDAMKPPHAEPPPCCDKP